jgi:hypothetical protein
MSGHLEQGDLRAWLDGELMPEAAAMVATHLGTCVACAAERDELASRASRVASAMSLLSSDAVGVPAFAPRIAPTPVIAMPVRSVWRWAVPAAAMAAALAFTMFVHRTPGTPGIASTPGVLRPVESSSSTMTSPVPSAVAAKVRKPRVTPVAQSPKSVLETFLALDDEPIETGMVVRVSSESGDVQADVLVGPDGRAHGIRILNSGSDF